MPTAAKIMSAVAMAILAFIVSEQVKPLLPEGTQFGYFSFANAGFASLFGWKIVGKYAGKGTISSVNNGITGVLAMVLFLLFAHAARLMYYNAIDLRYKSTAHAVQSVFDMMLEHAWLMMTPTILLTILGGALFIGLLAEATDRRWS